MPARRINLLPQDAFTTSPAGRILFFSLTVGRYVVIFTELIVILAFLSRFFLDRQTKDLEDKIKEQVKFLQANQEFEQNFRFTQGRLVAVNESVSKQFGSTVFLDQLTPLISPDIVLTRTSVQEGVLQLSGTSLSVGSLRQTIAALQKSPWLSDVSLSTISTSGESGTEIRFALTANINPQKIPKGGS